MEQSNPSASVTTDTSAPENVDDGAPPLLQTPQHETPPCTPDNNNIISENEVRNESILNTADAVFEYHSGPPKSDVKTSTAKICQSGDMYIIDEVKPTIKGQPGSLSQSDLSLEVTKKHFLVKNRNDSNIVYYSSILHIDKHSSSGFSINMTSIKGQLYVLKAPNDVHTIKCSCRKCTKKMKRETNYIVKKQGVILGYIQYKDSKLIVYDESMLRKVFMVNTHPVNEKGYRIHCPEYLQGSPLDIQMMNGSAFVQSPNVDEKYHPMLFMTAILLLNFKMPEHGSALSSEEDLLDGNKKGYCWGTSSEGCCVIRRCLFC